VQSSGLGMQVHDVVSQYWFHSQEIGVHPPSDTHEQLL
jgi:hypothetical protein